MPPGGGASNAPPSEFFCSHGFYFGATLLCFAMGTLKRVVAVIFIFLRVQLYVGNNADSKLYNMT